MERVKACLEEGAPVFASFWDDPTPFVEPIHSAGALIMHQAGSVEEARRAVDAGVDVVIAQGWEAGGHVRGENIYARAGPAGGGCRGSDTGGGGPGNC